MKKVLAVSITIAVLIIVVFILNRELPQATATVPGTTTSAATAKAAADTAIGVSDLVVQRSRRQRTETFRPERQSCPSRFLGHLVRTLQNRNSLAD